MGLGRVNAWRGFDVRHSRGDIHSWQLPCSADSWRYSRLDSDGSGGYYLADMDSRDIYRDCDNQLHCHQGGRAENLMDFTMDFTTFLVTCGTTWVILCCHWHEKREKDDSVSNRDGTRYIVG